MSCNGGEDMHFSNNCFVLFCFVLFCFVLFCFVLFYGEMMYTSVGL